MSRKVSILSDSISTLEGYNPPGFLAYYALPWMPLEKTWWHQVLTAMDAQLAVNSSFSGSTAASHSPEYALFPAGCSDRRLELGEDLDDIFIFLGTNDALNGVPLQGRGLDSFEGSMSCILKTIHARWPQAHVYVLMPPHMPAMAQMIESLCRKYNAQAISLEKGYETYDGFHPTQKGMQELADQVIAQIQPS